MSFAARTARHAGEQPAEHRAALHPAQFGEWHAVTAEPDATRVVRVGSHLRRGQHSRHRQVPQPDPGQIIAERGAGGHRDLMAGRLKRPRHRHHHRHQVRPQRTAGEQDPHSKPPLPRDHGDFSSRTPTAIQSGPSRQGVDVL